MATTNDLKNGLVLNIDGQLWTVVEFQHVKPGKGGAFVRTKLKNVLTGKVVDRTFNAGLKVETATVDKREMQYLYKDGDDWIFMDTQTYDQTHVPHAVVGDMSKYLLENQTATVATHEGVPIYIELPASVELDDHLHRARPAGRPLHGRHQARHPRDRRRDPGAAVHRVGHQGQGRHPRRVVPRPHQRLTRNRYPQMSARSKARKRALDVLYEADIRGTVPTDVLAATRAATRPTRARPP